MAEPVRIALLGRLAVVAPGAAAKGLPGRRAELVFAYLAAEHHRTVSRDELADALWPDRLPPSWSAALRGVVTEVRRFLDLGGLDGEEVLATARSGYQLILPPGVVTDLDVVRGGLAEGAARLGAGNGGAAASAAAQVSSLAGLAFLPDHDGEWVEGVRRELRRAHVRSLALEAEARALTGNAAGAHDAATRLVELDPFDESSHQLRIRLLAEAGDSAGAARAYDQCREVLAAELGVEPAPETAAARLAERRAPVAVGRGLEGIGVLVVEDHDFQRRTLLQILTGIGVGWVDAAADGTAALDRLSRPPFPDVIICDIDMPEMDGVELVRHISTRHPGSAVVITSGLDASVLRAVEELSSGYGLEVLAALAKPLTARRLREVLAAFTPRPSGPADDPAGSVRPEDIRRAMAEGTLTAHFQPRLDLTTGDLCAVTATLRWPAGRSGVIAPSAFLPVASEARLLGALTDHLLELSCSLLDDAGLPSGGAPLAIVVALPRSCLLDVGLADRWADLIGPHPGRPREQVVAAVEVRANPAGPTELDVTTRLRLKGFGLALHAFDGGPTALHHAARLPLTGVTIAGRLVSGASAEAHRRDLLEAALDAARPLGLPVAADGCDTAADFEMLLALGCPEVQGQFLGLPMAADQLSRWAQTWPSGVRERA